MKDLNEPKLFRDPRIKDLDECMIEVDSKITNGITLKIDCEYGVLQVEILLTYEELQAAIKHLELDRNACPHIYKPTPAK